MVDAVRSMTPPTPGHRAREALLLCLAVPFLGILFGGIYSVPAIQLSRGRDPWLSVLLLSGLALTVFGAGSLLRIPAGRLAGVYVVAAVAFFVVRRVLGGLERNLERFGVVHLFALMLVSFAHAATLVERHPHQGAENAAGVARADAQRPSRCVFAEGDHGDAARGRCDPTRVGVAAADPADLEREPLHRVARRAP
jgi:hypothetical protein